MKNLILTIGLFTTLLTSNVSFSQQKRTPASFGRAEYVEVEKNVKLPPLPRESLRVVLQFKILKNTNIV